MLYAKGAKIWIPHSENVWEGATLEANYSDGAGFLKIVTDSGQVQEVKLDSSEGSNLPPLRNPAIVIGNNNLLKLSHLSEPGVLHNLAVRYCERQMIYTYCGIVLLAINPFVKVKLYSPSVMRAYRGRSIGELDPHIFALAEAAYTRLEREKCNLSIIVSGESGAGKTVSAKYAMRYFAAVGGSEFETQIERKVLASSPIMEAFGNAKTTHNDNSSRFGKFTKLLFKNNTGTVMNLTGATMHTYLLEKSRVVSQTLGERNYHIFYQLCAARNEYPQLALDHQNNFVYLNMGRSTTLIDESQSDSAQFVKTFSAMRILGLSKQIIDEILKIIAGILHLGNIKFSKTNIDSDACEINENDFHLHTVGELLKINADDLRCWLITRKIESRNEFVLIPKNIETAKAARDALAKHIYANLFQYIVSITNTMLNNGNEQSCFIGVLDIYGFETFAVNSFEQFCINYANEKLQQHFYQHVFKLEQEEYLKEGITWTMIDFYDNQPCIDLIESKLGILDLLDEECMMPRGSEESWAVKLFERCNKSSHFKKPRFGATTFLIKHFSDTVEYAVNGFLEKNRDTVSKELMNVLRLSEIPLCSRLTNLEEIDPDPRATIPQMPGEERNQVVQPSSKQHKKTVGSQFRASLSSLISTLHATQPHYVRCIKPNDDKISFHWNAAKIVHQLRACGVLETVRISATRFPTRCKYDDFYMRFQLLRCHRTEINENDDIKQTCVNIVEKYLTEKDNYRFGNKQIFFRSDQMAYLEQIRENLHNRYITIVQSVVRRYVCRKRYLHLKNLVFRFQCHARGYLARCYLARCCAQRRMRETHAAIIVLKFIRGCYCRRRYLKLRHSVSVIQQYARGMLARRRFHAALEHNSDVVQLQRFIRGYLARCAAHKRSRNIIICQAAIRRFLAIRKFLRIKQTILNERGETRLDEHKIEDKRINMNNNVDTRRVELGNRQLICQDVPQGLIKFHSCDLDKILQRLVTSMNSIDTMLPGIRAHIIFMCIRYTDSINADNVVRELLSKFIMQLKKLNRTSHSIKFRTIWLVNAITLFNLLKQYGDVDDDDFNTEEQNTEQQLKNFNLIEYRCVIHKLIDNLYQALVLQIQRNIKEQIVPAIFNNIEVQHRTTSTISLVSTESKMIAAWRLLVHKLEKFRKQFQQFGLDACFTEQIFTQVLFFICAVAINWLMAHSEICMRQTGMAIRYNVDCIEDWLRLHKMTSNDVFEPLARMRQVAQLLLSHKSDENDVQNICNLSTSLNAAQVLKIMKSYKTDEYELEITNKFLTLLEEKLNARNGLQNDDDEFTMDQKFIQPFKVVFKYSNIKFEDIEIPTYLNLDEFLTKI